MHGDTPAREATAVDVICEHRVRLDFLFPQQARNLVGDLRHFIVEVQIILLVAQEVLLAQVKPYFIVIQGGTQMKWQTSR